MAFHRSRVVATSLTAVVTVATIAAMAETVPTVDADAGGDVAGALAAAVGENALAEMAAPATTANDRGSEPPPVVVSAKVQVRVS